MIKDTSIEQGDVRIEAGNTHTIIYGLDWRIVLPVALPVSIIIKELEATEYLTHQECMEGKQLPKHS